MTGFFSHSEKLFCSFDFVSCEGLDARVHHFKTKERREKDAAQVRFESAISRSPSTPQPPFQIQCLNLLTFCSLKLTFQETEEFLSNLVVSGTVEAKMDRLAGIVQFAQHKDPSDILNDWAANLSQLMMLVNKTNHLINKEEMVHVLH